MKKLLLALIISVYFLVLSSSFALAADKTCGGYGTNDYCGAAGGCLAGSYCKAGWYWETSTCVQDSARCDNADQSLYRCGYSNTGSWCGGLGGCADGYRCNGSTYTCEKDTTCDNMAAANTGAQCGKTAAENSCGTEGGCAYGYRCVLVNGQQRPSCLPDASDATNICPGTPNQTAIKLGCGTPSTNSNTTCDCAASNPDGTPHQYIDGATPTYCCGWTKTTNGVTTCQATDPSKTTNTPTPTPLGQGGTNTGGDTNTGGGTNTGNTTGDSIDIFAGPTSKEFNLLNPLQSHGTAAVTAQLSSPGGIISRILQFAFPIAGLILFFMLVVSGFQIVVGGANGSKAIEAGKQRATNALIGFTLLFVSYWLMQIIEVIFGITIF